MAENEKKELKDNKEVIDTSNMTEGKAAALQMAEAAREQVKSSTFRREVDQDTCVENPSWDPLNNDQPRPKPNGCTTTCGATQTNGKPI